MRRSAARWLVDGRFFSVGGTLAPVLGAAALALGIEIALQPPRNGLELVSRLVGYPVVVGLFVLIGRWLGLRTWPRRGRRMARRLMARAARDPKRPIVFLTDRPDGDLSIPRRVLEVVGFAAGSSIIVAAVLSLFGVATIFASTLLLPALWGSFLLVPYWSFARLGIRQVDPVRWLVQPMSRRYADRLRLSNGALLLIAVGVLFNFAFRAGASGDQALVQAIVDTLRISTSALVVAASAVAYYARDERALLKAMEEDALRAGIRDGRGMSDGDFLPRVPAAKA
ncbi:MAG TPA: hypothetical protein VHH36_00830 [Candidatus Thermoplasmatota archaeon]|nr:hypothetical protein [Candidatus Thermoplasmatota archaeon]